MKVVHWPLPPPSAAPPVLTHWPHPSTLMASVGLVSDIGHTAEICFGYFGLTIASRPRNQRAERVDSGRDRRTTWEALWSHSDNPRMHWRGPGARGSPRDSLEICQGYALLHQGLWGECPGLDERCGLPWGPWWVGYCQGYRRLLAVRAPHGSLHRKGMNFCVYG